VRLRLLVLCVYVCVPSRRRRYAKILAILWVAVRASALTYVKVGHGVLLWHSGNFISQGLLFVCLLVWMPETLIGFNSGVLPNQSWKSVWEVDSGRVYVGGVALVQVVVALNEHGNLVDLLPCGQLSGRIPRYAAHHAYHIRKDTLIIPGRIRLSYPEGYPGRQPITPIISTAHTRHSYHPR